MVKISQPKAKTGSPVDWPVPPLGLMEYGENAQDHLATGKKEFENMRAACAQFGVFLEGMARVLDFGCSNGRVTRWFPTTKSEVWGSDIQMDKVLWAQENLGPPLRFLVNGVEAHLPFPDGYFDYVAAQSVFTHVVGSHVAWMLELCRVLSRNGVLFITLHDEATLDPQKTPRAQKLLSTYFKGIQEIAPDLKQVGFLAMNPYTRVDDLAQVYMSREYLVRALPPWMNLVGMVERAYSELQTAYILRKQF